MAVNRFIGSGDFTHIGQSRVGVLLSNLGTPDAPTAKALRPYLREFFTDERVIELPRLLWWAILNFTVMPTRPAKSAELYRKIWKDGESPLRSNSVLQKEAFERALRARTNVPFAVELGMRYGNPSIPDALERLRKQNINRLLVLPLYPQYSATTSGSTFDAVSKTLQKWRWVPDLHVIMNFHDHSGYIQSLARSIREIWEKEGRSEKLLFSFHGIPKRYFENGDPYPIFCRETARLTAEALGLNSGEYQVSFQSLFGKEEWLRPYTEDVLREMGGAGLKSLDVVCPGFAADCLETLEEIGEQDRDIFLHAGGGKFRYLPALNDRPDFIESLVDLTLKSASWF